MEGQEHLACFLELSRCGRSSYLPSVMPERLELERMIQALELIYSRRLLNISYKDHVTNEGIHIRTQDDGVHDYHLNMMKKHKLSWYLFVCVEVLRPCQQLRSCQAGQLPINVVLWQVQTY